jgi:hypothetical protein
MAFDTLQRQLPLPLAAPAEPQRAPWGKLSIRATEDAVSRLQAKVEQLRLVAAGLEEGTPQRQSAIARLDAAECALAADSGLVNWMKRRLKLFRTLGVEHCQEPPTIID